MPWYGEASIAVVALFIVMWLGRYLTKENKDYHLRIDQLRTDYLSEIKDQRVGYENRMDMKNDQLMSIVSKFDETSHVFNSTIEVTLARVCAERDKEDEMLKSFMEHVRVEHEALLLNAKEQKQQQLTMSANQERVAHVLDLIADKLAIQLNGKS